MAKPVKPEPKFFLVDHIYAKGLRFLLRYLVRGSAVAPAGR